MRVGPIAFTIFFLLIAPLALLARFLSVTVPAYALVVFTIVVQGLTMRPLLKRLALKADEAA